LYKAGRNRSGNGKRAPQSTQNGAASKADSRREAILGALRRCVVEKGYASTSLNDLAKEAGMSPSHLLYYYPGKEAALEDLYREISARMLSDVAAHGEEPPEEQCHALADYLFAGHGLPRSEQGVFMELITQALHNPKIEEIRDQYTVAMLAHLENIFGRCPRLPGLSSEDAAVLASSVWMGLVTVACFHKPLNPSRTRRLFRQALLHIAGLDQTAAQRSNDATDSTPSLRRRMPTRKARNQRHPAP
jgi:AcrR family transcriptional regulator